MPKVLNVIIKTILWDVDGTLLDFHAAESAAVRALFHDFGPGECTDEFYQIMKMIFQSMLCLRRCRKSIGSGILFQNSSQKKTISLSFRM